MPNTRSILLIQHFNSSLMDFDGVYGFPNIQEQENFDYIPGDYYNMDDFDMNFNWTDSQT